MKFDHLIKVWLFTAAAFPSVAQAAEHGAMNAVVERVRNECGFDLRGPFASAVKSAAIDIDRWNKFSRKI